MSDHRYDIRISENCIDPNPLMVERQDPDNFTRFQTRERCALEIAAYVIKRVKQLFLYRNVLETILLSFLHVITVNTSYRLVRLFADTCSHIF